MLDDIAKRAASLAVDQLKPAADAPAFSEAQVAALRDQFSDLLTHLTPEQKRTFVFAAGEGDQKLVGSKFSRHGLTTADIEWLYDTQVSLKGQKKIDDGFYSGPSDELERAFQDVSEAYYVPQDEVRKIDQSAIDNLFPRLPNENARYRQARADAQRAMDTAESGFGSQLVGAQYVGDLWEAARPDSRVFGLLDTFEMAHPTAYLPVEVDIPEMLFVPESTANNSSNYATVKTGSNRVSVSAKKFVIHQMWSGEMEEDSIIPFVPFLRRQAALSIAHYSDSLVLNGDDTNAGTGNINLDDADPADTKHYLAFDGIRHAAIVDNTANAKDAAGVISINLLRDLRGLMIDSTRIVDWGHPTNADDLVFVTDPETADRIQLLDEVLNWKLYNNQGAILNGEVGRIIGHPVISSMAMSKTEADYKVSTTGGNNIKGQVASFNRRGFKVGWRRRVRLETERLPATDQTRLVYSLRLGFGRFTPTGAASGIEAAAVLGNISL